jgi:1,4-alpha-glucan branching enzyme
MSAKRTATPRKSSSTGAKAIPRPLPLLKRPAQPVLFEHHDASARQVCIAGSFNEWRPDGLDMINLGGGKWAKELLLPPGTYEYRFVVDGNWICDPSARNTVPNPFGEPNSVRHVADAPATNLTAGLATKREATPGPVQVTPARARQRTLMA